jgi:diguanylate cyclase (GGDEF)-like protein
MPSDAPDDEASACLVVLYAGGYPQLLGRRFGLSQPVTELGRSAHNHITLHSDGISRSHARIVREQADFVLVDDGSTNGTFVDQEAERTVRRVLCDGDQIMLGDAILVFLSGKDLAQRYRAAIAYLSEHDGLTRLANHAHWLRLTEHGVLLARAEQRPLSLLLVDIDHLAQVNQRVGALGGNSVLSAIADALRAELGSEAVLGRTEGGRFGVALPGRDLATSVGLGERLRQRVAGRTLTVRGESLQVTLSVGAATLYRNTGSQELLEDAQAALLRAKAGGRDRVCAAHD